MAGQEHSRESAFRLLFEADEDGTRFFQLAVVQAAGAWEAQAQLETFLARGGVQLVWVDPEETRPVDVPLRPRARYADAALGVVEVSERLRVVSAPAAPPPPPRGAHLH